MLVIWHLEQKYKQYLLQYLMNFKCSSLKTFINTMKNTIKTLTAIAILVFITFSFTTLLDSNKNINVEKSIITWKGYQVTGSHTGTIKIKSGLLIFTKGDLVDGNFVMDMNSISCTDLGEKHKGKLEEHLKSDDFFGVVKHQTATLEFIKVIPIGKNSYKIKGDLTIKGKTNSIDFDFSVYGKKATALLKIDRTKYDVKYGSKAFFGGLKDNAIYDEFELIANLEF